MKLVINIDPLLPSKTKKRSMYCWELITNIIGISALITFHKKTNDKNRFNIFYGFRNNFMLKKYDLYIPYNEDTNYSDIFFMEKIPIIYTSQKIDFVVKNGRIGFDIIGVMFHLLSLKDEYDSNDVDYLGRYDVQKSDYLKHDFFKYPIVNLYISLIKNLIVKKLGTQDCVPMWKDNKVFAVALSHDVDSISRFSPSRSSYGFKRAINSKTLYQKMFFSLYGLYTLILSPLKYVTKNDNGWPFKKICCIENQYNVRSTFFMLPINNFSKHYLDSLYSYNEKIFYNKRWTPLKYIMQEITKAGWRIGLHSSINTNTDAVLMTHQKECLEKLLDNKILSNRQHFLMFIDDKTLLTQESSGFKIDSTIGFNAIQGFRSFICSPYKPFSLSQNRPIDMWELPITIQDISLFSKPNLKVDNYFKQAKESIIEVMKYNGAASISWHTNCVNEKRWPGWLKVYEMLLGWLNKNNAYIAPVEDIIEWWEYRSTLFEIKIEQ